MNKCKCGCGKIVKNKYARGHNARRQGKSLKCWKCGMKSINMDLFVRDRRLSSGRKNLCKNCQNQMMRELIETNDKIIKEAKNVPCKRCGRKYPDYVMDFHHRVPSEKTWEIGRSKLISVERLLKEIKKCDVYCANCHRIIEKEHQAKIGHY